VIALTLGCILILALRCLGGVIAGIVNLAASIAEGFALSLKPPDSGRYNGKNNK